MRGGFCVALLFLALSASAADFVVTNTNASGDGSLAQAILSANAAPGSRVLFGLEGTPPFTIELDAALPPVIESTDILGESQPGYVGRPWIRIVNRSAGPAVDIRASASGSSVTALEFLLTQGEGVLSAARYTSIAACTFARLGAPKADEAPAIRLLGDDAFLVNNRLSFGSSCLVAEGAEPLVFSNTFDGCYATAMTFDTAFNATVGDNVVGPAVVYGSPAIIVDADADSCYVARNRITGVWGGIDIRSSNNYVAENDIPSADTFGIRVDGGTQNRLTQNHVATSRGIVLVNGGNHALQPLVLDRAVVSGNTTSVRGHLGKPGYYEIQVYASDGCSAQRRFVGSGGTDQGFFTIDIAAIAPGTSVSAVAIDSSAEDSTFADTSAFSNCVTATGSASVPAPAVTLDTPEGWPPFDARLSGAIHENARVFFGAAEGKVTRGTTPRLVRVPEGSGTVNVVVRHPDGRETSPGAFTYRKPCYVYVNRRVNDASIRLGESTTLSVLAATEAPPMTYQWYLGRYPDKTRPIVGASQSSITVSPTSTTEYWVMITNACGRFNVSDATVSLPRRRATR